MYYQRHSTAGGRAEKLLSEKQGRDPRPESEAVGAPLVGGPK